MITWDDLQKIDPGNLVDDIMILYTIKEKETGVGMGANAASVTLVFESGEVWYFADPSWTGGLKPRMIKPPLPGRRKTKLKAV